MRKAIGIALVCVCPLAAVGPVASAPQASVKAKVIVNAGNPAASLSAAEVSQLFMRRTTQWPRGGVVRPVDLPVGSVVREAFSREIHGRSALAVDSYWTKQIFSGAALPPVVLRSERDVLEYVRQNVDAIGYVSAEQPLGEGLKALDVVGTR